MGPVVPGALSLPPLVLSRLCRGGAGGGYLRRFLRPSYSSAPRASPDVARTGPTVPHLRQRATLPPSARSMTIGATWPHRSGAIGVMDIFAPPPAYGHLSSTF